MQRIRELSFVAAGFRLLGWVMLTAAPVAQGQMREERPPPISLAAVRWEISQHVSVLRAPKKPVTDRFSFATEIRDLSLFYSSQTPSIIGHKEFAALPGGYQLAGAALKQGWGSISAFRSTGFMGGVDIGRLANRVAYLGGEVSRAPLSTRVSAYVLRAAATSGRSSPAGSQAGLEVSREYGRGSKVSAEWSHARLQEEPNGRTHPRNRNAIYVKWAGPSPLGEAQLVLRLRGDGFGNPAVALAPQAVRFVAMTLQRKLYGHQLVYSCQFDSREQALAGGTGAADTRREDLAWAYAARFLPRLSLAGSWIRENRTGRPEAESSLTVGASRKILRLQLSLAHTASQRQDVSSSASIARRSGLVAATVAEISPGRRVEVRYERNGSSCGRPATDLLSSRLRIQSGVATFGNRISLSPALDYRQLRRAGGAEISSATLSLSAQLPTPRRFRVGVLSLMFATGSSGFQREQSSTDVIVRWGLKSR